MPKPSVARMVHYVSEGSPLRKDGTQKYPGVCRSAVVTEAAEDPSDPADVVGLCVLNPTGMFFRSLADGGSVYSDGHEGGTWHWPERVE